MKRFLICRNINSGKYIVIKNGDKKQNITKSTDNEMVNYRDGFLTVSNKFGYVNIYETVDEFGNLGLFDNIKLRAGALCPWDENYEICSIYTPEQGGVYEIINVNPNNYMRTYHSNINKEIQGITIFDQVYITEEGLQIGVYRDTLPILLGKPSPILNSVTIISVIYINNKINKYYYVKYIDEDTRITVNNRTTKIYLKLPENHIMNDGKMLSGWSNDELVYGKILSENKILADDSYNKFQSKKYWNTRLSLTDLINSSTNTYVNMNYRKHSSDDCYGKFILYLENRDESNNINYSLIGICEDGFVHIGDSGYLDTECLGIKKMDIDIAIAFMQKYRDLMLSRDVFEYELVNVLNVEQNCVNISFEHSYNTEDDNRYNNMMKLNV